MRLTTKRDILFGGIIQDMGWEAENWSGNWDTMSGEGGRSNERTEQSNRSNPAGVRAVAGLDVADLSRRSDRLGSRLADQLRRSRPVIDHRPGRRDGPGVGPFPMACAARSAADCRVVDRGQRAGVGGGIPPGGVCSPTA